VLIRPLTMTPMGDIGADARACGLAMPTTAIATRRRTVSPVIGGAYGTGLSAFQNGNTKRPEGLGGSAG
jgi:hypothetical protein